MTRILHTADIHLDSPLRSLALRSEGLRARVQAATRRALESIVDLAIAESCAAVLIAGDLFDGAGRSARTGAFLIAQLDRLRAEGIAVFYIRGNHDAASPITGNVELPGNVHVFTGRGGHREIPGTGIHVHGVSFSGRHAPDSLLPKFGAPVAGAVNIAMLHTSLAGAAGHDPYAPCSPAELAAMGFDYWALGHVHRRQVHGTRPWIVMPGMPQGRDIGEDGPKSATLIEIGPEGITAEERVVSPVEFLRCPLDITGVAEEDALRDLIRAEFARQAGALVSEDGILRLQLTGESPLHWRLRRDRALWEETAEGLARATGRLWLESLDLDLAAPGEARPAGAVADLAALMDEIAAGEAFRAEGRAAVEAMLSELSKVLPRAELDRMAADEAGLAALAERLLASGAEEITARMTGAAT
ncbi:DNA repair exonuclease [Poseidonocella sp. HB161398]|uniref:metallophosphoesterase family protein n=1 Tax=Poseidonocella sp. HB161398 TaxID=2320855 RepID=UPI0011089BF1|nr:DNA repair exonuclease [Poseidonocella sp. HB161398]